MTCAHDSKSRPASHSSPSYLDSSREKPTGVTPDDSAARLFWLDLQDRARKKSGAAADTATPRLVRLGSGLSLASSFHLGFGCPASRARGGAGAGFGLDPAWRTEPGFRGCDVARLRLETIPTDADRWLPGCRPPPPLSGGLAKACLGTAEEVPLKAKLAPGTRLVNSAALSKNLFRAL
jgi:hypothetical protein